MHPPRLGAHPLALFSLEPLNDRARAVVSHPSNSHLVSISSKSGVRVLDIGFHIRSQSCNTLATLGRNDTDILVGGSSVARLQCSFEIEPDSGLVMLYDRSNSQTTQVFGDDAIPFEHGRLRRVVVQDHLNTTFGMGGVACNLVQFRLIWHQNPLQTTEKVRYQKGMISSQLENSCLARTEDEVAPVSHSPCVTRIHTLGASQPTVRYIKGEQLGNGQFGTVYKSINVDSGKIMAVKILHQSAKTSNQEGRKTSTYHALKREVETLSRVRHPHIIDYISSQGWGGPQVEIFMGLKEGTLEALVESERCPIGWTARCVFQQILSALDYLAAIGIVHRDVKPTNILYTSSPDGQYQFQLGDFGLCNRAANAITFAGSPLYMAPEMFRKGDQTHKVDVWSLFVTLLWTLDVGGFRQRSTKFKCHEDVLQAVSAAAKLDIMSPIQEMAVVDPKKRASAAQMLVKHFGGAGLSTSCDQVSPLTSNPPHLTTTGTARLLAPSTLPARTAPAGPRPLPKNTNLRRAIARNQLEKARGFN